MVVDYYSRFPVIRLLSNMTGHTVCNHFTSILAEYGLPATIVADFGSQFISERFKTKCEVASHYTVLPHTTIKPTAWQRGQLEPASHS